MKTPYDTALRLAERKLDKVRAAIGHAVEDLQRIEAAHCANDAALMRECVLAAGDPRLTTESFFLRARERRVRLSAERAHAQARLEALRIKAVEHYGSRTAVEGAAAGYRGEADRAAAAADQAAADDLTGARRHRRPRAAAAGSPP